MCTSTCITQDGSGHTVLGSRAVFLVCCVLTLCPFILFIRTRYLAVVALNFAQVFVPRFLFLQIVSLAFRIQSVCVVSEVLFFG